MPHRSSLGILVLFDLITLEVATRAWAEAPSTENRPHGSTQPALPRPAEITATLIRRTIPGPSATSLASTHHAAARRRQFRLRGVQADYDWERLNVEFRAEFFDLFNHPQFGPPNRNCNQRTFGGSDQHGQQHLPDRQFGLEVHLLSSNDRTTFLRAGNLFNFPARNFCAQVFDRQGLPPLCGRLYPSHP